MSINRDKLRKYAVERGTPEECNEVVRLLEELGERVFINTSWKGLNPYQYLYHGDSIWYAPDMNKLPRHCIEISITEFLAILKGNQTSSETTNLKQGKTTAELVLTYFKQKQKTKDMQ